jgi:hypothetical protein
MRRLVAIALLVGVVGCGKLMRKPGGEAALRAESTPPAAETKSEALATKGAPVAAMPSAPSSSPAAVAPAGTTTLDTAAIEEATGLTGAVMADGVFRITRPRGDLKVALDGFPITPRMGLAGGMGFRAHPSGAMLVGVMPVAADELQTVVSAFANAGLEVTALHSHFVGEEPRILFIHFGGVGNAIALARGVHDVQDAIVRVRTAYPLKAAPVESGSDLDVAKLDALLGLHGERDNGVYRVAIPRPDVRVTELGVDLGATMSPTSWAAFEGTAERAAVAGELMVTTTETQPVIHTLREARIGVVGIHDNSSREDPRLVFVSFWGVGRSDALAAGVRKALDQLPRGG